MKTDAANKLKDGAKCKVIGGTHKGKSGVVMECPVFSVPV